MPWFFRKFHITDGYGPGDTHLDIISLMPDPVETCGDPVDVTVVDKVDQHHDDGKTDLKFHIGFQIRLDKFPDRLRVFLCQLQAGAEAVAYAPVSDLGNKPFGMVQNLFRRSICFGKFRLYQDRKS